jgi:hypothetical protein
MSKPLNDDEKLESVFNHISSLYKELEQLKQNPDYIPFNQIPEDKPNPEKCLKEEILQFSQFANSLNRKTRTYFVVYNEQPTQS